MRVLVHDYAGHPFQVELSRELAGRGHDVTHSWCDAYSSGKGHLAAEAGETLRFRPIGQGEKIEKLAFARRLVQELRFGLELARLARAERPDTVMVANAPIPTLVVFAAFLLVRRTPWVLWHQDVQAVAIKSFAGKQLSRGFALVGKAIEAGEKWCSRRAAAVVVIAESFLDVHRQWGTSDKTTVIPNWAPLDEIYPVDRKNDWAVDHELDDVKTLLYSGTLGLKHNPALLVGLAREVIDGGQPVRLVVVNEGPAVDVLRDAAARLDVPLTLLPFQPYDRLPEVLGSGDLLVVLLEQDAGAFSVPSKTLSYLCAGRPVLGLMPSENLAAGMIASVDGCVLPPDAESLPAAAEWVREVIADRELRDELGEKSRFLAEQEFALDGCADKFEEILQLAVR
ncbi:MULTISPECIES: glycosyltransferase family 4 protein [unclassified Nocardioides]|uniref:glycosyltransferase family 4 protein n=1 Tax=unclassified Nocardioides TaxID=2615069 RepID=UPI0007000DE3|nr:MULTISPECIES: glycosyltransferase family 4 protein [unclassified Nocardioides]KQY56934.1 glycosyl transferase family 1 [Nocardioides sp. Root140]KRF13056.1 glycosyl transferase family 1 [Nocardioides sp. Soil796]